LSVTIDETDFDLRTTLKTLGYSNSEATEVEASQVLLLPQDIHAAESIFRSTSISLKKEMETKMTIRVLSRQREKSHYFAERAADIVAPILVFLSLQAFDIGKAILASWLYDQMLKLRRGSMVPSAKLTVIVVDEKERVKKRVTYDGPANKIPEIIRNTKLGK
jgi:hypothetical protein